MVRKCLLLLALVVVSGCSLKTEFGYHGRTGLRNVNYSPIIEDGDDQYVQKINKRY